MSRLSIIRERVRRGDYLVSDHMLHDKMRPLRLTVPDIENAICSGYIVEQRKEPLGRQYIVEGPTLDYRVVRIPVRLEAGLAVLITVYVIEE